jgi:hypothetical protein
MSYRIAISFAAAAIGISCIANDVPRRVAGAAVVTEGAVRWRPSVASPTTV